VDSREEAPKVSVILPTWNRATVIGRAIASVLAQTEGAFELLVVDDGSTDGTVEAVRALGDPRIRVVERRENRGPAAARNAGIDEARADLVAFHDSDDEWMPDKLARHLDRFAARPEVEITHSDMLRVHADGSSSPHPTPDVRRGRWVDRTRGAYQVYGLGIQSAVFRRTCFDDGTRFDETLLCFEDLELFQRLSRTRRFEAIHSPLVRYYEGPGVSTNLARHLTARRRLLFRWMPHLALRHPWFFTREFLKVHKGLATLPRRGPSAT
jgi:glycosyltransferase involved in cell wall biosynthesis